MSEQLPPVLKSDYVGGKQLSDDPQVWEIPDFAHAKETKALRDAAAAILQRAEVSGDSGGFVSPGRSGSNCWIKHNHD
jgi:prolyl 4-hydroxylase